MIVRILTARVADRNAAAFEEVLRQQLPVMREHAGLVYLKLARQSHPGYEDVLLFEEWRDSTALYAWAGADILKPRLLPGAEGLAESVEVTHYEALDIDPDEISATWAAPSTGDPAHDRDAEAEPGRGPGDGRRDGAGRPDDQTAPDDAARREDGRAADDAGRRGADHAGDRQTAGAGGRSDAPGGRGTDAG